MSFNSLYSQNTKQNSKSNAKGLEKVIIKSSFAVIDVATYVNTLFYGKGELPASDTGKRKKNPLDKGIIPILDVLASIDLCELLDAITNALGNVRTNSKTFDPNKQPTDTFGKIKWRFQKTAFDAQTEIDGFYNEFDSINSELGKVGLLRVLTKVRNEFSNFTALFSNELSERRFAALDPDIALLLDAFPKLKEIGNYVNDSLQYFDRFTDTRQLTGGDVDKALDVLTKIRQYCIIIQSLNDPTAIAAQLATTQLSSQVNSLLKDIDVQQVVPTLKNINEALKKLLAICNNLNKIIRFCTTIIRVFSTVLFAFKVVIRVLKTLPAPNAYTTVGITNTASDALNEIKRRGPGTAEVRLSQISTLLDTITLLLNTLLPIINDVIQRINNILSNLERCNNAPVDLTNSIKGTVSELQSSVNELQAFIDNKRENDLTRSSNSQFGQYTIQIITEEVIEEAFSLRRRYGIALNNIGIAVVRSQPTFASDDNVIINEVKLLLQQAGLVEETQGLYTDAEQAVLNDAASYLFNDDINIQPSLSDLEGLDSIQSSVVQFTRSNDRTQLRERARNALKRNRERMNSILGTP